MKCAVSIITEEKEMLPANRIATHPGEMLVEEFLKPSGITQAELARSLKIPINRVNEIVKGKRGITAETAWLLAAYFKNSAEFWMNLQTAHDLSKAKLQLGKISVTSAKRKKRSVA
jgi:addiction module HigA family antidote